MKPLHRELVEPRAWPADEEARGCRRIGSLLREARGLTDEQVARILAYQRARYLRFGEAAVALRFVERKDVLEALSRQFQYTTGFAGRETSSELSAAVDPFGEQADAFRELRSRLLLEVMGEGERRALAVLSPDIGDGKTYLAANLAVAFSQLGDDTLLVDADIRTPRQHEVLGVGDGVGLTSVLAGFTQPSQAICQVPGLPHLYLLPAGAVPPNPLELLQRGTMGKLVADLLERFRHVVVDTPAASRGADSRVIASRCGAALVVARQDRSRMDALGGLVDALARASTPVAGVVVNEH